MKCYTRKVGGPDAAIALGTFDGVHLGHQTVLEVAQTIALCEGLTPCALSFLNHPLSVVGAGAPPLLTLPAEKATRRPRFRLWLAAFAVRQLAMVAVFMPIKPDRPLKKPPVKKAKGVKKLSSPAKAMQSRITNTTAKKMPTPRYCRFR